MMKSIKKGVLIGLLLALGLNVSLGEDLFARSKRKMIKIACVEYPPFNFKDGTGAAAAMLFELFDNMGYDVTIKVYPLGRVIRMVNMGTIQAAKLFPQTDPEVTVSIPIYYSSAVFLYKKSRFPDGLSFNTLSDLRGYRIGALSNSKWSIKLLQKGAGLKLDFASSNKMNMKKLYADRIDILPLIHITALSLMDSLFPGREEAFGLTEPFHTTPVCLIFSTNYPGNENTIDDVKKKIVDIDMQDLLQKHFGKYFPKGIIPPYIVTGEKIK